MADYDSGLPVRSEADGTDERVQVKIVDKAFAKKVVFTYLNTSNYTLLA